jgi:Na+/H+ antiporter NhaD/arsenite permease-like protein
MTGNAALGVLSAILDNIPLTAAAIGILTTTDPAVWSLLALTVGTGGSMLVIGSAAGVVAMGRVEGLTFLQYMRIATIPTAAGYVAGIAVWYAEYTFVR